MGFTVSYDNTYAFVLDPEQNKIAQVYHNLYAQGYNDGYADGRSSSTETGQEQGWGYAYGKVRWPGYNTSSGTMSVSGPASTYQTQETHTYTLSMDGSYAYIKNENSTTVARIANNYKYSQAQYDAHYNEGVAAGYTACYNSIEIYPTYSGTLSTNTEYTINARAYSSPSATSKTNRTSITFKTPGADYWSGFDDGWKHYYDKWQDIYVESGGKYKYLARTPIDHYNGNYTQVWSNVVAGSGGGESYTRYQFYVQRTQNSSGYHYTLTIDTGWSATFGANGSSTYLYKKA